MLDDTAMDFIQGQNVKLLIDVLGNIKVELMTPCILKIWYIDISLKKWYRKHLEYDFFN